MPAAALILLSNQAHNLASLICFALLALLICVTALPNWNWDTVQIYVHCCNQSGPWNEEALGKMKALGAGLRFVVQERPTARFQAPINRSAEKKRLKQRSKSGRRSEMKSRYSCITQLFLLWSGATMHAISKQLTPIP
jgi:hypothetical protein